VTLYADPAKAQHIGTAAESLSVAAAAAWGDARVGSRHLRDHGPLIHNKLLLRMQYVGITILQINKHNDNRLNPHIFQ